MAAFAFPGTAAELQYLVLSVKTVSIDLNNYITVSDIYSSEWLCNCYSFEIAVSTVPLAGSPR